jgi:hypothetical protein
VKRAVSLVVVVFAFGAILIAVSTPASSHARKPRRSATPITHATLTVAPSSGWCGQTESDVDRADAVAGAQVHVIYAYPSDTEDQFDVWAPRIAQELAAGDQWWREQDPTRAVRFDMAAFAGCTSAFGQLDISSIRIDQPARDFLPESDRLAVTLRNALEPNFERPGKIYLVFVDGDASTHGACGRDFQYGAVIFLGAQYACPTTGKTAMHELLHALGAVFGTSTPAPHACPDHVHVCDSDDDIIAPGQRGSLTLTDSILDVGRDDYYGNGGPSYDVRKSPYLVHLDVP